MKLYQTPLIVHYHFCMHIECENYLKLLKFDILEKAVQGQLNEISVQRSTSTVRIPYREN